MTNKIVAAAVGAVLVTGLAIGGGTFAFFAFSGDRTASVPGASVTRPSVQPLDPAPTAGGSSGTGSGVPEGGSATRSGGTGGVPAGSGPAAPAPVPAPSDPGPGPDKADPPPVDPGPAPTDPVPGPGIPLPPPADPPAPGQVPPIGGSGKGGVEDGKRLDDPITGKPSSPDPRTIPPVTDAGPVKGPGDLGKVIPKP